MGRAAWVARARLTTGLVLFSYLTTHLLNHALGLVSLAAMDEGRAWFLLLWRSPAGTAALYGSLVTHVGLAFWSLYRRRTLRMPRWEAAQLVLGLLVPPMLAAHIVGNRVAHEWFGVGDTYTRLVLIMWHLNPFVGWKQTAVLVVAWLHGSIGLHFWLRLRPWYGGAFPALLAAALLVPTLALLGFVSAGREVSRLATARPDWARTVLRDSGTTPERSAALKPVEQWIVGVFLAGLGATLLARAARRLWVRQAGLVRLTYPGGREVIVPPGYTVLEASRFAGIAHASVCGGRGRCSTCRIRIGDGAALPAPGADEARVLRRVRAPANVRLACQLRPRGAVAVTPLVMVTARPAAALEQGARGRGEEREITVLFADLRGFTRLAERKLPYDVVFFLNRYFETVGGAIERAEGVANQFTGDGVMALFGMESDPERAARQALVAAAEMIASVARLSRQLADELDAPLRMGIGIHAGPAVVGEMGYGRTTFLTAVGDTVHVASRLEALTKEYECELVISDRLARLAGLDTSAFARHELTLRNRTEPLAIWVVPEAARLGAPAADGAGAPA